MGNFQNVRKKLSNLQKEFRTLIFRWEIHPSRLVGSRFAPMFHVLSWGIPYALLLTGSPVVFSNNFTDPGAVFFFSAEQDGEVVLLFFFRHIY